MCSLVGLDRRYVKSVGPTADCLDPERSLGTSQNQRKIHCTRQNKRSAVASAGDCWNHQRSVNVCKFNRGQVSASVEQGHVVGLVVRRWDDLQGRACVCVQDHRIGWPRIAHYWSVDHYPTSAAVMNRAFVPLLLALMKNGADGHVTSKGICIAAGKMNEPELPSVPMVGETIAPLAFANCTAAMPVPVFNKLTRLVWSFVFAVICKVALALLVKFRRNVRPDVRITEVFSIFSPFNVGKL